MGCLTLGELRGLGQDASACGPQPAAGPGESAACCPGVGWVLYGPEESPYGICERARAAATSGSSQSDPLPTDPVERVAELRRRLDARREAQDEERHQRMLQEVQLRSVLGRVQAIQAAEAARLEAEARDRRALEKARADAAARKKLAWGAGALAAVLILRGRR